MLTCLYTKGVTAASQTSKDIRHLYDISASNMGTLVLPTDVESYKNRIFIVDSGNNQIVVTDQKGEVLFSFGHEGQGEGEFLNPVGLGIDREGQIYVADTGNNRIQIFSAQGQFLTSFAVISDDSAIRPIDVAIHPLTKHIFVTGNNNHKVMVFNRTGRLLYEWGGNGADAGKFRYPATIAITPELGIGVVDVFNTRIQLFQQDGTFLVKVGEWGVLPGQLFRPKGIAVDQQGSIYVSDSYMNIIQVFNDSGVFLYVLNISQTGHEINTPAGMAVDGNNRLYVAEMLNHRVSVFQLD